jgi:hypothetical protein
MDYPRFERVAGPQDKLHLSYHGGRAVEAAFKAADLIAGGWPRCALQSALRRFWSNASASLTRLPRASQS